MDKLFGTTTSASMTVPPSDHRPEHLQRDPSSPLPFQHHKIIDGRLATEQKEKRAMSDQWIFSRGPSMAHRHVQKWLCTAIDNRFLDDSAECFTALRLVRSSHSWTFRLPARSILFQAIPCLHRWYDAANAFIDRLIVGVPPEHSIIGTATDCATSNCDHRASYGQSNTRRVHFRTVNILCALNYPSIRMIYEYQCSPTAALELEPWYTAAHSVCTYQQVIPPGVCTYLIGSRV